MKQLRVRSYYKLNYANDHYLLDIMGGDGASITNAAPGPLLMNTTVRNLSIFSKYHLGFSAFTIAIQKNLVNTALTASIGALATSPAKDITHSVSFVAGDRLGGRWTGTTAENFGVAYSGTLSLELEATDNQYGLEAFGGGRGVGEAMIGGALGNGYWQQWSTFYNFPSNTYAPCALDGIATGLGGYNYAATVGGSWDLYLVLYSGGAGNVGVLQDGTGGTVNTKCTIIDGTPFAQSAFSLPIFKGDYVDVICFRRGTNSGFAVYHVAATISFAPTIAGRFMFCGGNNFTSAPNPCFKWVENYQDVEDESDSIGIIGPNGITAHGLAIDINNDPSPGTWEYIARKTGVDTVLDLTFTGFNRSGLILGDVIYPEDSEVDIKEIQSVSPPPAGAQLHWGMDVEVVTPVTGGTLIVTKVTNPSGSSQDFDFTINGGLSPSPFTLQDGDVQQFDDVTPGTYDLEETPVSNWTTGYSVSNGSPHGAITVDDEEVVTVTVTNTHASPAGIGSGIYKIVPNSNKTNDTLWDENFTGTHNVKIP